MTEAEIEAESTIAHSELANLGSVEDDMVVEFFPGQHADPRKIDFIEDGEYWIVKNIRLEQMVRMTPYENEGAREPIYDVLKKWHIPVKLIDRGAKPDPKILIEGKEISGRLEADFFNHFTPLGARLIGGKVTRLHLSLKISKQADGRVDDVV